MQRARRLASVVVIATLGLTGLSACRSEPTVAAYLPGDTLTIAEVSTVYEDAQAKLAAAGAKAGASAPAARMPITRQDIVNTTISRTVLLDLAKQRNLSIPADLPLAQYGQSLGLPADAAYVKSYTEVQGLLFVLGQQIKPVEPTTKDLSDVFDRLKAVGSLPAQVTFEQFNQTVSAEAKQTLGGAIGIRNEVQAQAGKMNIKVNPRFDPAEIDIYTERAEDGRALKLVVVPLTNPDGSVPVTDVA